MRSLPLILVATVCCSSIFAQEVAELDRATQGKLKGIVGEMSQAMKAEDEAEVRRQFQQAIELMGDQAGLPESADEYRAVPDVARPLTANARNPDFQKGIFNADSSVEALVLVKSLPPHVSEKLNDCGTDEALAILERYAAYRFRNGNPALSPGAWGQLLAFKKR
jgi:23S rRNA A1618 N6-methylase RlmF